MRLKDKIAIVVGAGQSPGEGLGNGRATVLRFAQESADELGLAEGDQVTVLIKATEVMLGK